MPEARNYRLQFNGESAIATAKQCVDSLHTAKGWKTTELDHPAGGGEERLFINRDRSRNDINKSRNLNILFGILREKAPTASLVKLTREYIQLETRSQTCCL